MQVAIHQPHYLPWLRYMEKIASSDLFIMLDDVDFTKNGWQNRNKIKCADGWMYLTVPVTATLHQPIHTVKIVDNGWHEKHLRSLQTYYGRAPYFDDHIRFFKEMYCRKWDSLTELNLEILSYCLSRMDIRTPVLRSSELKVEGVATERLVNLCRLVKATSYYSGAYAAEVYLDAALFEKAGIDLVFQHWCCPEYSQQFPKAGFVSDLSIVDLLFNEGPKSLEIIQRGARCEPSIKPVPVDAHTDFSS